MQNKTLLLIGLCGLISGLPALPQFAPFAAARADPQAERASRSGLTGISLPADTARIRAVPDGVRAGLSALVQTTGTGVRQGRSEILVWNDDAAKAAKGRIVSALQSAGWQLTDGDTITDRRGQRQQRLILRRSGTPSRTVVGFWADNGETLVLAWTEVLTHGDSRSAMPLTGGWRVQVPGQPPTPAGVLSLRTTGGGSLTGTFTPPGKPSVPLKGVTSTGERFSFRFTLPGKGKTTRTFQGAFTPTLDADAWTGQLSGPTGKLAVDLVRQR